MKEDHFIRCNAKTLEMFDCTQEQILGEAPYRFSPELQPDGRNSREKALKKINTALAGEPRGAAGRGRAVRPDHGGERDRSRPTGGPVLLFPEVHRLRGLRRLLEGVILDRPPLRTAPPPDARRPDDLGLPRCVSSLHCRANTHSRISLILTLPSEFC